MSDIVEMLRSLYNSDEMRPSHRVEVECFYLECATAEIDYCRKLLREAVAELRPSNHVEIEAYLERLTDKATVTTVRETVGQ